MSCFEEFITECLFCNWVWVTLYWLLTSAKKGNVIYVNRIYWLYRRCATQQSYVNVFSDTYHVLPLTEIDIKNWQTCLLRYSRVAFQSSNAQSLDMFAIFSAFRLMGTIINNPVTARLISLRTNLMELYAKENECKKKIVAKIEHFNDICQVFMCK